MAIALQKPSEHMGLLRDALVRLSVPRKTLPSKYFYDAEGSRLFEAICELPEYHVTRMETAQLTGIVARQSGWVVALPRLKCSRVVGRCLI